MKRAHRGDTRNRRALYPPCQEEDRRQHVCRNCTCVNILLRGPDVRDIVIIGVFGIDSDEVRRFPEAGQRNEWPGW